MVVNFAYQNLLHFVFFLASRVGKRVFEIDAIFSPIDEQTVLLGHRVSDAKEAELSFDVFLVALLANGSVIRVRLLDKVLDIESSVDGDARGRRSGAACDLGRGVFGQGVVGWHFLEFTSSPMYCCTESTDAILFNWSVFLR